MGFFRDIFNAFGLGSGDRGEGQAEASAEYYRQLAKTGGEQWDWYKAQIQPRYAQELQRAFDPKAEQREEDRARTDWAANESRLDESLAQSGAARGLSPEEVGRVDPATRVGMVAGRGFAAGEARRGVQNRRFAMLNPGFGMAGQGQQAISSAASGFGGLASQSFQREQSGLQNLLGMGAGIGMAASFLRDGGEVSVDETGMERKGQARAPATGGQPAGDGKQRGREAAMDLMRGGERPDFNSQRWFDQARMAGGGAVQGEGGPREDANTIHISDKEIVISAAMRDYFGERHFDQMFRSFQKSTGQAVTGMPKVQAQPTTPPVQQAGPGAQAPPMGPGMGPGMRQGGKVIPMRRPMGPMGARPMARAPQRMQPQMMAR